MTAGPRVDWEALERAARDARANAHAPYSRYRVGAAVLAADGRVFAGCNVENASFGATVCAERSAVVAMVTAGQRELCAVLVVTRGPEAGSPCGICRQTLAEFAADAPVRLLAVDDDDPAFGVQGSRETSVAALLPLAFRGALVTG